MVGFGRISLQGDAKSNNDNRPSKTHHEYDVIGQILRSMAHGIVTSNMFKDFEYSFTRMPKKECP